MAAEEKGTRQVSRRSFLKTAGLTAGAAGILAASGKAMAADGNMEQFLQSGFLSSGITYHDEFPYDVSGMKRYDQRESPLANGPKVLEYLAGRNRDKSALQNILDKKPGFTHLDYALYDCGWTGQNAVNFYNWDTLGVARVDRLPTTGKWTGTPDEANIVVKKAARVFGAAEVGVCKNNELWYYSCDVRGVPFTFTDEVDVPTHTPEAHLIPKSMQSVVVCLIPIDQQMLQFCPGALGEGAVSMAYSRMAELAGTLAEFIRQLGYNAIPMGNDTSLSVAFAIDAGLGEQGRNNVCISPVLGAACRPIKVLTDMPITPDKRITFGVKEFCKTCKKCARECPAGAICMDTVDHNDPMSPGNNPGGKDKWYIDNYACYGYWCEAGTGCGICLRACPFTKPNTWMHNLVKGVSARTSIFDPLFIKMDEMMGYGSWLDEDAAVAFWKTADWPTKG